MHIQIAGIQKKAEIRVPQILSSEDELGHIEVLAEGAMHRNPALADRLMEEISRARIVKANKMRKDSVSVGSTVTYHDETIGQTETVALVCPERADITRQQISIMTPIGVALLGLSEDAAFYWDTRDDQRRMLTIIAVEQPSMPEGKAPQ